MDRSDTRRSGATTSASPLGANAGASSRAIFGLRATGRLPRFVLAFWFICAATTSVATAQAPYPTTAAPPPVWGGYALPEAVPYQPTLTDTYPGAMPDYVALPGQAAPQGDYLTAPVVLGPAEVAPQVQQDTQSLLPPGTRNGVFQKIKFTGTWLPRIEDDSLGTSDLQLDVVFGLPFFTRETPLVITPTYAVHYLDGPVMPDVPPRVHDAQVNLEHFRRVGDSWIIDLNLTLGEYADDHSFDADDAFRITGSGTVVYEASPAWRWVLGAAYVDRANTEMLPIAGVIYEPNDDVEYRLVFPAPKVAWRLPSTPVPGCDERWLYVGGEFGGGVWAVTRTTGATDELDVTDWRVFLGLERKVVAGLSRRVEVGYVFSRTLQYASTGADISLDDMLMLRAGLTY